MIEINTVVTTRVLKSGKLIEMSSCQLLIDGNKVADDQATIRERSVRGVTLYIIHITSNGLNRFSDYYPTDFPDNVQRLSIDSEVLVFEAGSIRLLVDSTMEGIILGFKTYLNGTTWKQPWSIREYHAELQQVAKTLESEVRLYQNGGFSLDGPMYQFLHSDTSLTIGEATRLFFPLMKQLHDATVASLASKVRNDALVASFQFPKEVSVPCEQYLLYFVQFLKDAGVEATADLQHNSGSLLFSVTPTSKEVALENISEALAAYLQLPSNPNVGMEVIPVGDIQTQQLIANVQHLQVQMRLMNAAHQLQDVNLQQKEGIIQDQRFVIDHQRKILTAELISTSLQSTSIQRAGEDQEEIFGGAVAFTSMEMYGTKVSTAKIFDGSKICLYKI